MNFKGNIKKKIINIKEKISKIKTKYNIKKSVKFGEDAEKKEAPYTAGGTEN